MPHSRLRLFEHMARLCGVYRRCTGGEGGHESGLVVVHLRDYHHVAKPTTVECAVRRRDDCGEGVGEGTWEWEDVVGYGRRG